MSFKPPTFRIYLITPDGPWDHVMSVVRAVVSRAPSHVGVQLRSKTAPDHALEPVAHALRAITAEKDCALVINDRVALAHRVGADGVHLPEAAPDAREVRRAFDHPILVGRSCHDLHGLTRAQAEGADIAVLGPIGKVEGKNAPMGVPGFSELMRQRRPAPTRPAVFGLGGVGAQEVAALTEAGATGVAVMRGVFSAPSPEAAIDALLHALERAPSGAGSV